MWRWNAEWGWNRKAYSGRNSFILQNLVKAEGALLRKLSDGNARFSQNLFGIA
jgi:hypothetical protein